MIDRKSFHKLSYGLYIISTVADGKPAGCVVNTFQQVTSSPQRVSVTVNKDNYTAQMLQKSGIYAACVIAENAPMDLIGTFGFKSSKDTNKFAETAHKIDEQGLPYPSVGIVARFSVKVFEQHDVGTHIIFVGDVIEAEVLSPDPPITYAYYQKVKGGKTPPKAPSYFAEAGEVGADSASATAAAAEGVTTSGAPATSAGKTAWLCTVCGHVEIADELPDDFKCPQCGQPKEVFEKITI